MTQEFNTHSKIHSSSFSEVEMAAAQSLSKYAYLSQIGELDVIVIRHPNCNAIIALQGGQLIDWQPLGSKPVIWISDKSFFLKGKAIRGGIPVCWPWFGPKNSPSHGFARIVDWSISQIDENEDCIQLSLSLTQSAETLVFWPHDFNLKIQFELGIDCKINLQSEGQYEFTTALHSYFALSDISNVTVKGVGIDYIDSLKDNVFFSQQMLSDSSVNFNEHIDRIYTNPLQNISIIDEGFNRYINLSSSHYLSDKQTLPKNCDIVIWNPGPHLSQSMPDMDDNGYLTMGCVESGIISTPIMLSDSIFHIVSIKISVKNL